VERSSRDAGDRHAQVPLAVSLFAAIALPTLKLDNSDFVVFEFAIDSSEHFGTIQPRLANLGGALLLVVTDEKDTIELYGLCAVGQVAEIDIDDVILLDSKLPPTIFNDCVQDSKLLKPGCMKSLRIAPGAEYCKSAIQGDSTRWGPLAWRIT